MVIKQGYFDLREAMEILITHMCDSNWVGSTYKSAFYSALSLSGRLSFCEERGRTARIGSGATLTACSAVNHRETFSVFTTVMYC